MITKKTIKVPPKALPNFDKPPVNEVVCGMRFETPNGLMIPHIGLLWEKFRSEYPNIQHASPIFSDPTRIEDMTTGIPLPRVWFINNDDNQLIQFQFDRFYYNWRRRQDIYPRYPNVIRNFESCFNKINLFFKENALGEIIPLELELSYINHIPQGEGWNTIEDIMKLLVDFPRKQIKARFLPSPIKTSWMSVFQLPDGNGHLTINVKQALRTADKIPIIILELISRRPCEGMTEYKDIRKWYDLAREWIVKGFTDVTSQKIQKNIWKLEK